MIGWIDLGQNRKINRIVFSLLHQRMGNQRRVVNRKWFGQSRSLARKRNGAKHQIIKTERNNAAVKIQSKENLVRGSSFTDGEKTCIWLGLQKEIINVDIFWPGVPRTRSKLKMMSWPAFPLPLPYLASVVNLLFSSLTLISRSLFSFCSYPSRQEVYRAWCSL